MPESFNVLVKEIRSLGISIELKRLSNSSVLRRKWHLKDLLNLLKTQGSEDEFDASKIGLASRELIEILVLWRS